MSKKVIVIIVEGLSDKIALDNFFENLSRRIKLQYVFEVTVGDITSCFDYKDLSINDLLIKFINESINKEVNYEYRDIYEVDEIVDTDGVFSDSSVIKEDKTIDGNVYSENEIKVKNYNDQNNTMKYKRKRLKELLSLGAIKKDECEIPFHVYYMSINLDHVLHDNANLDKTAKKLFADSFSDDFYNKFDDLVNLFREFNESSNEDYSDSWDYIKEGNNSLKKTTNLIILINRLLEEKNKTI